jgi:hypothetical protein
MLSRRFCSRRVGEPGFAFCAVAIMMMSRLSDPKRQLGHDNRILNIFFSK